MEGGTEGWEDGAIDGGTEERKEERMDRAEMRKGGREGEMRGRVGRHREGMWMRGREKGMEGEEAGGGIESKASCECGRGMCLARSQGV